MVLVLPLLTADAIRTDQLVSDARAFNRSGQMGPDRPDALEILGAVRAVTVSRDVVGFEKARAMTHRTNRWALQVDQQRRLEWLLPHLGWWSSNAARRSQAPS